MVFGTAAADSANSNLAFERSHKTGHTDETKMALPSLRPKVLLRGFKKKKKSKSEDVDNIDVSERTHSIYCPSEQANHRGSASSDSIHASFQLSMDDVLSRDSIDRCVHQTSSYGSVCDHTDSEEEELDSQSSSEETYPDECRHAAPPGHTRKLRYHLGDECRPRSITFLDEERGLTPRHLVTQCTYLPSLTDEERGALFYNVVDFERFEKESLYEEMEEEIRALELAKEQGHGLEIDDERIRSLIHRAKSHCNTHYLD